jgi:hypothetical protein
MRLSRRRRNKIRKSAIDVLAERQRQIDVEGWSEEHDSNHTEGSLAMAAAVYAAYHPFADNGHGEWIITGLWPWDRKWFKSTDPRRDLVKAGALILAELDRIDRMNQPSTALASRDEGGARS